MQYLRILKRDNVQNPCHGSWMCYTLPPVSLNDQTNNQKINMLDFVLIYDMLSMMQSWCSSLNNLKMILKCVPKRKTNRQTKKPTGKCFIKYNTGTRNVNFVNELCIVHTPKWLFRLFGSLLSRSISSPDILLT